MSCFPFVCLGHYLLASVVRGHSQNSMVHCLLIQESAKADALCRHEGVKRGGAGKGNWGVEGEEGEPLAGAASLEEDPSAAPQPVDGDAAADGDEAAADQVRCPHSTAGCNIRYTNSLRMTCIGGRGDSMWPVAWAGCNFSNFY